MVKLSNNNQFKNKCCFAVCVSANTSSKYQVKGIIKKVIIPIKHFNNFVHAVQIYTSLIYQGPQILIDMKKSQKRITHYLGDMEPL